MHTPGSPTPCIHTDENREKGIRAHTHTHTHTHTLTHTTAGTLEHWVHRRAVFLELHVTLGLWWSLVEVRFYIYGAKSLFATGQKMAWHLPIANLRKKSISRVSRLWDLSTSCELWLGNYTAHALGLQFNSSFSHCIVKAALRSAFLFFCKLEFRNEKKVIQSVKLAIYSFRLTYLDRKFNIWSPKCRDREFKASIFWIACHYCVVNSVQTHWALTISNSCSEITPILKCLIFLVWIL